MPNFITVTRTYTDTETAQTLVNLDEVIGVSLFGKGEKARLVITTTGRGSDGTVSYWIDDPGYSEWLFQSLKDQSNDYSWDYYLSQIK